MTECNAENERIKRAYFAYLREAKRMSEASVDKVADALHRFETFTKRRSFKAFHIEQAIAFKRALSIQTNARTGKPLSKATIRNTLAPLKAFFQWLAGQPGFRSRLSYADAEYFNMPENDLRAARATTEQPTPSLEQIEATIAAAPTGTSIERRDRALIAFMLLTGARDGTIPTLKLKHVDCDRRHVRFDARDVQTKFGKSFTTTFFPVGADIVAILTDWIEDLRTQHLFSPDDPLFPATRMGQDAEQRFQAIGLDRTSWSSAAPVREVFKKAFARAGLPYFHPHSFRRTLAQLGERLCRTPEEFKAWSQNLGHEQVMTTFNSYGSVASHRQAEIIEKLAAPRSFNADAELAAKMAALIESHRSQP